MSHLVIIALVDDRPLMLKWFFGGEMYIMNKMKIPIVDEQDNILYHKDSKERDPRKEITRIAALWVVNEKGEFLIAKRSKNKKHHPNVWGPSVAGTVEEGESYEENIIKEAREEIGLNINGVFLSSKKRVSSNHEYFCQYFFAKVPYGVVFHLQESEVDEVKWISLQNLKVWVKNPGEFVPTFIRNLDVVEDYANKN